MEIDDAERLMREYGYDPDVVAAELAAFARHVSEAATQATLAHGMISVEYKVSCIHCSRWTYLYSENLAHAVDNARAKGWGFSVNTGRWSCPEHYAIRHQPPPAE